MDKTTVQKQDDLKAIQYLMKTKGWKVFSDILKNARRNKTIDILNNKGRDEKVYSQSDLYKEAIRQLTYIIELPWRLEENLENMLKTELWDDTIDVWDVDELFTEIA